MQEHSDFAKEMAKQFRVGEYKDVRFLQGHLENIFTVSLSFSFLQGSSVRPRQDTSPVYPILLDTERTLAVLQGLRACYMVQSLPVSPEEEECEKWLSLDIFSGGFEMQPLSSIETRLTHKQVSGGGFGRSLERQVSVDMSRFFIYGLMNPEMQDEKVTAFLSIIQRYCRYKNLSIPLIDQSAEHPVENFGRLFLACLIKLHDLVPTALGIIEQETNSPNNELDPAAIHLPSSLADVCKVVFDAKILLVKARQESSCTYEEVCRDPIARCWFVVDNARSPMLNVVNVLHRSRIQVWVVAWFLAGQFRSMQVHV